MCCAHCLRGDAESIDIQEKYIDAFLDNFEKGAYISSLTFTGGEISLNIPAIRYTLKAVKERGIAVGSFYMVTNGKAVDKMADLAMTSLEWWAYCDEKDDYMCGLCISSDNFHEVIPYESKSILSGLKYNRNDKVTDFHLAYLLNEGRAKNLDFYYILGRTFNPITRKPLKKISRSLRCCTTKQKNACKTATNGCLVALASKAPII